MVFNNRIFVFSIDKMVKITIKMQFIALQPIHFGIVGSVAAPKGGGGGVSNR